MRNQERWRASVRAYVRTQRRGEGIRFLDLAHVWFGDIMLHVRMYTMSNWKVRWPAVAVGDHDQRVEWQLTRTMHQRWWSSRIPKSIPTVVDRTSTRTCSGAAGAGVFDSSLPAGAGVGGATGEGVVVVGATGAGD